LGAGKQPNSKSYLIHELGIFKTYLCDICGGVVDGEAL